MILLQITEQIQKIDSLRDALLFIVAALVTIVIYQEKNKSDLNKEIKTLKDTTIAQLEKKLERYEEKNK